jgi:hypothetical protein
MAFLFEASLLIFKFRQRPDVKFFDFFARPFGFAQEFETRLDTWIFVETFDSDQFAERIKSVKVNQFFEDFLQGYAVQRVFGIWIHCAKIAQIKTTGKMNSPMVSSGALRSITGLRAAR